MSIQPVKKILIAPLDWGLGHTTRCIPVMQHLLAAGHTVVFAGNEWQRSYITETFPGISTTHIEGYNVRYSKTGTGFMPRLLSQVFHVLQTIRNEHTWLVQLAKVQKFDAVISDNRYGLYHPHIPSVILTHQLSVLTGMGGLADAVLRKLHYRYLSCFNQCWVVDNAGETNLAGKLSHPPAIPASAKYIGLLSQMQPSGNTENNYLLILLSGPEPQRSILSALLWQQAINYNGKVVFVEGSDNAKQPAHIPAHISYYKRIGGESLQPLLQNAEMVICRSGYSTLMDLVTLNKKAILIPTPGQTEQEYLGRHLHEQGIFYCLQQKKFDLQKALAEIEFFPFKTFATGNTNRQFISGLDEWLPSI